MTLVIEWPDAASLVEIDRARLPVIVVGSTRSELPLRFVAAHDFQGAYVATQHLLGLGHERVTIVNHHPWDRNSADRHAGWYRAAGFPAASARYCYVSDGVVRVRLDYATTETCVIQA